VTPLIRFERVTKTFGHAAMCVRAVDSFSLDVPTGDFCSIMGPSGSGKSTLLHCLAGFTPIASGEIYLDGRPISQLGREEMARLRRREIGFVFQFFNLLPYVSAERNVALPLVVDGRPPSMIRERVEQVLRLVELLDRRHHKPGELSGGEMQRVAIARALVASPRLVLADEPTGNLDSTAAREIVAMLRRMNEELGITIVMVTHDATCASWGNRVIRLVDGRIAEEIRLPRQSAVAQSGS
jgi:putative ABC transport system ATP-binding protein